MKDMLADRKVQQEIQRGIFGSGPRAEDSEPAGRPSRNWLDSFLPIAEAADAGSLYVDLRDGDQFGCVWEWYPEGGTAMAPWWSGIGEMIDDVADALVEGQPALLSFADGAGLLPEVDEGYLLWSAP